MYDYNCINWGFVLGRLSKSLGEKKTDWLAAMFFDNCHFDCQPNEYIFNKDNYGIDMFHRHNFHLWNIARAYKTDCCLNFIFANENNV